MIFRMQRICDGCLKTAVSVWLRMFIINYRRCSTLSARSTGSRWIPFSNSPNYKGWSRNTVNIQRIHISFQSSGQNMWKTSVSCAGLLSEVSRCQRGLWRQTIPVLWRVSHTFFCINFPVDDRPNYSFSRMDILFQISGNTRWFFLF